MKSAEIAHLLKRVAEGRTTPEEALERLKALPFEDLEFAKVDSHRHLRRGYAEVVYGQGKTDQQVAAIVDRLYAHGQNVIVTRSRPSTFRLVQKRHASARFSKEASMIYIRRDRTIHGKGTILVVSAGTSDIPVAEEAALTAELLGNRVERVYDVGVAGIHRLISHLPHLQRARAIVAVAGMEGALPSVVSGLVSVPVVAVPTSTGYGASFHGIAALLGMLNSCSSGVAVVNIDNGFGAGFLASLINRL
ncbi:MAG: nickel pincer cofactor biosynthesis protein LarB [Acidobacteriota bacterium]